MKKTSTYLVLFFCISTFFISNAQVIELVGTWNLNEFTVINEGNKECANAKK